MTKNILAKFIIATAGVVVGLGAMEANPVQAITLTSAQQEGTLFFPNELVFDFKVPQSASDVKLNIFAFGDFNSYSEYISVSAKSLAGTWQSLGNVFEEFIEEGQYESELTSALTIPQSLFNSLVSGSSGSVQVKLTPSGQVNNLFDESNQEYAYVSLSYNEAPSSVPEPATLTGLAIFGLAGLLLKKKATA